jgi:hypothetical protein
MPETSAPNRPKAAPLPPEIVNIGGTGAALLAVVAVGAALTDLAPAGVWITAACYGFPAAVAFAAYCWIAHRR